MDETERPDYICRTCWNGDHSHHQPRLGGICIGCACEETP